MKQFKNPLFFVLLLAVNCLQAQDNNEMFYVLHVIGNITNDNTDDPLKTGDILKGDLALKFATDNDIAVLASTQRGRMVLFKNKKGSQMGELKYYLINNVLPVDEYTGTRANQEKQYAYLVFDKRNHLLFPKYIKVSLLPKNEESYYFIQLKVNGEKIIIKPELNNDKKIIITSESFIKNDTPIDVKTITDLSLYFFKAESNKNLLVKGINLSILCFEDVKKEVETLQLVLLKQGKNQKEITQSSINYLKEVYGKLEDSLISMLLK